MTLLHMTPQQIGEALEDTLDCLHMLYDRDELAYVWHNGVKAIKRGDDWIPQASRPDYGGILYKTGRAIVFDAKHCLTPAYHHDVKRRAHQLMEIHRAHAAGAVAGILVANIPADRAWWLVPSDEWAAGQFKPRTLAEGYYGVVAIPRHSDFDGAYVPDWLSVAR